MKNSTFFFIILLLIVSVRLEAVVKTTISNGNWSDSTIWSPAGVPVRTDDIIITTDVILDQFVDVVGPSNSFILNSGASLISIDPNDSTIMLILGVDYAEINGELNVFQFDFGARNIVTDTLIVKGIINVTAYLFNDATIINQPTGKICVGNTISAYGIVTNYGDISTNVLANAALFTGTGRVCISTSLINMNFIGGTMDICDATPNDPSDLNMGTIDFFITYCQQGPCEGCTESPSSIVGMALQAPPLSVAPNPMSAYTVITVNEPITPQLHFELMTIQGKVIYSTRIISTQFVFERNELEAGIYLYRVVNNGVASKAGKLIVQ